MHSYAQNCCYEANWMPLSFVRQKLQMSVPGSAGFLGIPGRSVQIKGQRVRCSSYSHREKINH